MPSPEPGRERAELDRPTTPGVIPALGADPRAGTVRAGAAYLGKAQDAGCRDSRPANRYL